MNEYELGGKDSNRSSQKTEVLFIEKCIDFLRPNGKMGIILPDGIITNESLQYVRNFLLKKGQILGIISLPVGAFTHYGTGVKASIIFLRKYIQKEKINIDYPIFMAIAEHIGYDTTGRPDKNEFNEILNSWRIFKKNRSFGFLNESLAS